MLGSFSASDLHGGGHQRVHRYGPDLERLDVSGPHYCRMFSDSFRTRSWDSLGCQRLQATARKTETRAIEPAHSANTAMNFVSNTEPQWRGVADGRRYGSQIVKRAD